MVNNVLAGVRDGLLIVVLLAVIVVGALYLEAAEDAATRLQPAPADTLPVDRCGGGIC